MHLHEPMKQSARLAKLQLRVEGEQIHNYFPGVALTAVMLINGGWGYDYDDGDGDRKKFKLWQILRIVIYVIILVKEKLLLFFTFFVTCIVVQLGYHSAN
jgi:hypothetical protein